MNAVSYFAQPLLIKPPARTVPLVIAALAHVAILLVMGKGLMVHFQPHEEPVTEVIDIPPISQPERTAQPPEIPLAHAHITLPPIDAPVVEVEPELKPPVVVSTVEIDPRTIRDTSPSQPIARVAPRLVYQTDPPYPEASRRIGEEGLVKLLITITPNGRVTHAQVQESSGSKRLDQAAIEAVRSWKYSPAQQGGMSISETIPVLIRFSLR